LIEIHELTKYFGETKAVGPLTFSIDKGEVVGLLGLNGAGKTTTLRMLSSDLLPTSGSMRVDGVDLVEDPEKIQSKIGYLPDRPPVYDEMQVLEYLHFAAKLRGMVPAKIQKRIAEVIETTDLGDHQHDRIGTLSHGFKQRVGIAQAIVHEPGLLLLDEPISGLDPVQIVEMRELIRSLRGDHTTVLSSHILSEISETCDRLLVIRDGEIVASGSEAELGSQMATRSIEVLVRVLHAAGRDEPEGSDFDVAAEVVRDIAGVAAVSEIDDEDAEVGLTRLRVQATSDVREELCRTLVNADIGVLALERSGKELESVFLELTGEDDSAEEGAGDDPYDDDASDDADEEEGS